jgi:hypothetical protein
MQAHIMGHHKTREPNLRLEHKRPEAIQMAATGRQASSFQPIYEIKRGCAGVIPLTNTLQFPLEMTQTT